MASSLSRWRRMASRALSVTGENRGAPGASSLRLSQHERAPLCWPPLGSRGTAGVSQVWARVTRAACGDHVTVTLS